MSDDATTTPVPPTTQMQGQTRNILDYGTWVSRLLGWDGILPISVFLTSFCVAKLFPQNQGVQTIALLVIPISAFFCRAYMGINQINSNTCGLNLRRCQYVALGFALLLFVAFDFLLVLVEFIPRGRRQPPPEDLPIWIGMIVAYFVLVTFAMYPGRKSGLLHTEP